MCTKYKKYGYDNLLYLPLIRIDMIFTIQLFTLDISCSKFVKLFCSLFNALNVKTNKKEKIHKSAAQEIR